MTTNSASSSVSGVYPYFYGFTSSTAITTYGLSNLNNIITEKENKSIDIYKDGILSTDTFYFIYDASYGYLSSIYYKTNNITSNFSSSVINLSSPNGFWASKQFIVYKSTTIANDYIIGNAYLNNTGAMIFDFNF